MIYGKPYAINYDMDDVATGNVPLIFGNFSLLRHPQHPVHRDLPVPRLPHDAELRGRVPGLQQT